MAEDTAPSGLFSDKAMSEMTEDEILAEVVKLRERRRVARERRVIERSAEEQKTPRVRRSPSEIGDGALGSALDDIFKDDVESCGKCGSVLSDGVCPNLSCEA